MLHVIRKVIPCCPKIPFWHSYEFIKDRLVGTGNIRNDVTELVQKQDGNTENGYHDLKVEQDIFRNILVLCKHYGVRAVLSSFIYYQHAPNRLRSKYGEGVRIENQLFAELSREFNVPFVD